MIKVMFSKESDEWETPKNFYNELDSKYNFIFDLACSKDNCKTMDGFTIKENALEQDWHEITPGWLWCNPPYSKCKEFVDKAWFEMTLGAKIVMLVPARTDTKWFHNFVYNKKGVNPIFLKGRLKFEVGGKPVLDKNGRPQSAPFPSLLIEFNA